MGPLSAKQHREYLAFNNKDQRENAKLAAEEARKDELHQVKLAQAQAKAIQGIDHKEQDHNMKVKEMGGPLAKTKPAYMQDTMSAGPMAQPTNPEAGPNDTIPAMLAPGEAVIPAEAAQHPDNKPIISELVDQGREMQGSPSGFSMGSVKILPAKSKPRPIGGKGAKRVALPKLPTVNALGYESGTKGASMTQAMLETARRLLTGQTKEKVNEKILGDGSAQQARKALSGRGKQLEEQERKAMGYQAGTTGVLGSGSAEKARKLLADRKKQLEEQERKAMGYQAGTTGVLGSGSAEKARKLLEDRRKQLEEQERKAMGYQAGTPFVMTETIPEPQMYAPQGPGLVARAMATAVPQPKQESADAETARLARRYPETVGAPTVPAPTVPARAGVNADDIFVPTPARESQLRNIVGNNSVDNAFYAPMNTPQAVANRNQQDLISINNEISRTKNPESLAILQAEKARILSGEGNESTQQFINDPRAQQAAPELRATTRGVPQLAPKEPLSAIPEMSIEDSPMPEVPTPDAKGNFEYGVISDGLKNRFAEIGNVLESPQTQSLITAAYDKASMEIEKGEDPKFSFKKMFESIYGGENSMFNAGDLARFAVLAAGGMVTGGSMAGSVRFAAADALRQSDGRAAGRAAMSAKLAEERRDLVKTVNAEGRAADRAIQTENRGTTRTLQTEGRANAKEAFTDQRELGQQLDGRVSQYLAMDVPSEVREWAIAERRKPIKTEAEGIARDRAIVQRLAASVRHKDPNADNGFGDQKPTLGRINGRPVQVFSKEGVTYVSDNRGGFRTLRPEERYLPESQFNTDFGRVQDQLKANITPSIRRIMGKNFDKSEVDSIASSLQGLYADVGGDPLDFAALGAGVTANLDANDIKNNNSAQVVTKAFYGQAVIAVNPTNNHMFKIEGENPPVRALAIFGDSMEKALRETNSTREEPTTLGKLSTATINEFNTKIKGTPLGASLKIQSDAVSGDNGSPYFGMTPYMIWVSKGMPAK